MKLASTGFHYDSDGRAIVDTALVPDDVYAEQVANVGYDSDRWWENLLDRSPEALDYYARPLALVLTGEMECGLCLQPTDGESVCASCGAAYHLDGGEWR